MDFDQWKIPRPGSACQRPDAHRRLTPPALTATFTVTGAWRSWLSRWPVKPEAAGSSPVAPALFPWAMHERALTRRTVPCALQKHSAGCSAVGSAFGSGPKGRRFKPAQPEKHPYTSQFVHADGRLIDAWPEVPIGVTLCMGTRTHRKITTRPLLPLKEGRLVAGARV